MIALIPVSDKEVTVEVEAEYIESVDTNHFITYNQGIIFAFNAVNGATFLHYGQLAVADIQFVIPADEASDVMLDNFSILISDILRCFLVDLEKVKTKFSLLFVC